MKGKTMLGESRRKKRQKAIGALVFLLLPLLPHF